MLSRIRISLCLISFLAALLAQVPTAEITGSVSDASRGVVTGATVTVTNQATNVQRLLKTNSSGIYDAPSLPPGVYSVKVSMPGFRAEARSNLELQVEPLRLELGDLIYQSGGTSRLQRV